MRVEPPERERTALARALYAAGAPVAAVLAGPYLADGLAVTLFADAPDDGVRDEGAMGRTLARFHAAGDTVLAAGAIDVPRWEPAAWLARWLADAPDDALRAELTSRAAALAPSLAGDDTLLHTDAHAGNFRVAGGEAILVDLEQVAAGPHLYDVTPFEVTERRFRGDHASWRRFAVAAGVDPDDPRLPPQIALREVLAVGFVFGLGHVSVARQRLAELDRPDARWTPF